LRFKWAQGLPWASLDKKNWSGRYLNLKLIFEVSSAQTWGSVGLQKHGFRVAVLLKMRLWLIPGFDDFWRCLASKYDPKVDRVGAVL
jgi:hypothetical protein